MPALVLCLVVGFLETVLLSVVLDGALIGNMKKAIISLLMKFVLYGVGFAVLYFFFIDSIFYAGAGFIAGVILSVIFIIIKSKIEKGDDKFDHSRDN